MHARLALEDGAVFLGQSFGATDAGAVTGEVVFNTALSGYQEALTDPSYAGQILVMTATQIGNYGVNSEDVESAAVQVAGFVVRDLTGRTSNHRSTADLDRWLMDQGVPAIEGIDTRALVRRLRASGAMRGVISTDASLADADLVAIARHAESMTGRNLAAERSPSEAGEWTEGLGEWGTLGDSDVDDRTPLTVVALDCGAKRNIYRHLVERGCRIRTVPFDASADEIRAVGADGLLISNGPGDPAAVDATIATLREVAGEIPTFGICLGHQLLSLAFGATTYKLSFGHRGANQPVRDLRSGRVEITSQNHGFCVDEASLPADLEVTHRHLNDETVAGMRHRERPVLSVQYHPEASPGPHDSSYLFDEFVAMMRAATPVARG